jgi:hypothetical protein
MEGLGAPFPPEELPGPPVRLAIRCEAEARAARWPSLREAGATGGSGAGEVG